MSAYTFAGMGLYLFPDEASLVDAHATDLVARWTGGAGAAKPMLPAYASATTPGALSEGKRVLFRDPASKHRVMTYRYGDSVVLVGLYAPTPQPELGDRYPDELPDVQTWRSWFAFGTPAGRPYQNAFLHILEGYAPRADQSPRPHARVSVPVAASLPAATGAPDRDGVYEALLKLNESQLDQVVGRMNFAPANLPGSTAPPGTRATAIMQLATQRRDGLVKLAAAIEKVGVRIGADPVATGAPVDGVTLSLLGDGEYMVEGAEDSRFLHDWVFELARPLRIALFHGKALRYARELSAAVSLGQPLPRPDLEACKQKETNVKTAAHNLWQAWEDAGLGAMANSSLGVHFDRALTGLVENAHATLHKLLARGARPASPAAPPAAAAPPATHPYVLEQQPWHGLLLEELRERILERLRAARADDKVSPKPLRPPGRATIRWLVQFGMLLLAAAVFTGGVTFRGGDGGTRSPPARPPVVLIGSGTVSHYLQCQANLGPIEETHMIFDSATYVGINVLRDVSGGVITKRPDYPQVMAMAAEWVGPDPVDDTSKRQDPTGRSKTDGPENDPWKGSKGRLYAVQIAQGEPVHVTFGAADAVQLERVFGSLWSQIDCLEHEDLEQWVARKPVEVFLPGISSGTRDFLGKVVDENTHTDLKKKLDGNIHSFDLSYESIQAAVQRPGLTTPSPWIAVGDYIVRNEQGKAGAGQQKAETPRCEPPPHAFTLEVCSRSEPFEPAQRGFFLYGQATCNRGKCSPSSSECNFFKLLFGRLKETHTADDFFEKQARLFADEANCFFPDPGGAAVPSSMGASSGPGAPQTNQPYIIGAFVKERY